MRAARFIVLVVALVPLAGCSNASLLDTVMAGAYRPSVEVRTVRAGQKEYRILAGDMHCHVSPPDSPAHVERDFHTTVETAREERMDFVVLTPHIWSRFFQSPELREMASAWHRELNAAIAADGGMDTIFVPGFEYSDGNFGHVGLSFANVDEVLADVPLETSFSRPYLFVDAWVRRGGIIVLNHPLQTSLESVIAPLNADLSFRPYTAAGPFPEEINAFRRHAHGLEAFNLAASRSRDRWILHDSEHSLRAVLHLLDKEIVVQQRMIAPTGGSDSHGATMRATTFVLAENKTTAAVRDGIAAGRTCVRDPAACTMVVRSADGAQAAVVGGEVSGVSEVAGAVQGRDVQWVLDGKVVGDQPEVRFRVPAGCSLLRVRVGPGFSAPVAVNCGFRGPQPR